MRLILLLLPLCGLAACERPTPAQTVDAATQTAPARAPRAFEVAPWTLPVADGAAQPDLVRAPDGSLLLSWIEREGAGHALRLARWQRDGFGPMRTVARGDDWFVNWADTPHVMATADGAVWAQWLRKTAAATYAYDVQLARSADSGATWGTPWTVNTDGTPTEHGFASLWPAARDAVGIAWLDGRHTGGGDHAGHGMPAATSGGSGNAPAAMSLRSAVFAADGTRRDESERDASTCDCCQTDVALAGGTPLVVYRDRTAGEIRDIQVRRLTADAAPPASVHADNWHTPGCPVNGPAIAARDGQVAVAWYSEGAGAPAVALARSSDAGTTFAPPVPLDSGAGVLGRVALAQAGDAWWVAWLREDDGVQTVHVARVRGSAIEHRARIATLAGKGRATGVPQLAADGDGVRVVWTDVVDGAPRLHGAVLR